MGNASEWAILKRKPTNGQQVYEKCLTSLIIREKQSTSTMRHHLTIAGIVAIKKAKGNMLVRMWRKRTLAGCWWECKIVQPLQKAIWRFLNKLRIELLHDPEIPILVIYQWLIIQHNL